MQYSGSRIEPARVRVFVLCQKSTRVLLVQLWEGGDMSVSLYGGAPEARVHTDERSCCSCRTRRTRA